MKNKIDEWIMGKRGKLYDKELAEIATERMKCIDKGHKKLIGGYRLENAIIKDNIAREHWKIIKKRLIHDIPRTEDTF